MSESQNPGEDFHYQARRPRRVADHAFAFEFNFQIGKRSREHGVVRSNIPRTHYTAHDRGFLLVIEQDLSLRFNHQISIGQDRDYLSGKTGLQFGAAGGGALSLLCRGRLHAEKGIDSSNIQFSRQRRYCGIRRQVAAGTGISGSFGNGLLAIWIMTVSLSLDAL